MSAVLEDDYLLASCAFAKHARDKAQALLCESFGPFGKLHFPYVSMGKIDSLHLFGDTELLILAMYIHNAGRWNTVLDIGANLGLHSICMARLGMRVHAYEPDFDHYAKLLDNLDANNVRSLVTPYMAAVHTETGNAEFVRVFNNLTGNHLEGYKDSYGPRETVIVPTVDCRNLWRMADFAKIDSEGNEADLCLTMGTQTMKRLEAVCEVRNERNAKDIFDHFNTIGVAMWSQKKDWERVTTFADMPHANREGSLFISHRGPFA